MLADPQAADDLDLTSGRTPELEWMDLKVAVGLAHEGHIVLRNPNHGIQWNNKLGPLRGDIGHCDPRFAKQTYLE